MAKTVLSVNLNKVALIRNSRGADYPNLAKVASDCEAFGAQGITIHPRPDERHARYDDVPVLKRVVFTELNVEGYPSDRFIDMILTNKPAQCTLVPDLPGALTSDAGWDTVKHSDVLTNICKRLRQAGIRSSVFVDPDPVMINGAKVVGADRVELYTGPYAHRFHKGREDAIEPYIKAAKKAREINIGLNAGHDLNLDNLQYFLSHIPWISEVSIGHALVCDAIYYGLKNAISMYRNEISRA